MIRSYNKSIACTPFDNKTVETTVSSGFATMKNKQTLTKHTVVYGNEDIPSGAFVYVPAGQAAHSWAKEVFDVSGTSFIFIPVDQIRLVETPRG
jgi:hypothetical protein